MAVSTIQNSSSCSPAQEVIIVSGLPRSGTSMMMKMLAAGGIEALTDDVRRADLDNPDGYFEFERVKQLAQGDVGWLAQAQGKAVKVVSALLPYLPNKHRYRIIFMERSISEIMASQRKMLVRRGHSDLSGTDAKLADVFEKHLLHTKTELARQDHMSVLYMHYGTVLHQPALEAKRIQRYLNRALPVEQMVAAVNAELYRNRSP